MNELNLYDGNDIEGGALEAKTIINTVISKIHTATIVQVMAIHGGSTGAVGFVDVLPLVRQVDAMGKGFDNVTVYKLPYTRIQGGANAVIIDPQVGDLGIALFASRDISAVKRNKSMSNPQTKRMYDSSDGIYIGGILNGAPSQYIHFLEDGGINAVATGEFNIKATKIVLDAPVETTSTLESADNITDNTSSGNGQTMASMRDVYNKHDHIDSIEGTTQPPNQKV